MFNDDSFAALVTPRFQYESASTCLHSGSKTVRFRATSIVRLKGSLGHRFALLEKP